MSRRTEYISELRKSEERHYNCAQAVLISFCDECGIDPETAYMLGSNFGGGMRIGSVCGALTGGLMAMGLLKLSEPDVKDVMIEFEEIYGSVECRVLLDNVACGYPRAMFCNELINRCIEDIEKRLPSTC